MDETSPNKPFRMQLRRWRNAYDAFFAALAAIPPDKREAPNVCGYWSAKEIAAHLAGWHYEAVRRFVDYTAGDTEDRQYDVDAFNAQQVEARAHLNWDQTVADLREIIDILLEQARDISEDRAHAQPAYAGWLETLARDADDHRRQIEEAYPVTRQV